MKLTNLSESFIKKFAGATIFGRGKEYFQNQMVEEITYDPARARIKAEVSGSSGNIYDVEIAAASRGVDAECSCPFEGYPFKHIVAVLLTFLKRKDELLKQSTEKKKRTASLKDRVRVLSQDRLTEILLSLAGKYPDCRRDLLIALGDDSQETVDVIKKQVHQVFRDFEAEDFPSSKVVKRLKSILASVRFGSREFRIKVYWAVSDRVLNVLNEYGMNDEPLEDVAIEALDLLAELFTKSGISVDEKAKIVKALEKYSEWGNCGIIDAIDEAAGKIKTGKA